MGDDALPWLKAHAWHLAGFSAVLFIVMFVAVWWLDRVE